MTRHCSNYGTTCPAGVSDDTNHNDRKMQGGMKWKWCTSTHAKPNASVWWGNIVNCLRSNLYGAMFWICSEKTVDNTRILRLVLNSAYRVKVFSASHTALLTSGLG